MFTSQCLMGFAERPSWHRIESAVGPVHVARGVVHAHTEHGGRRGVLVVECECELYRRHLSVVADIVQAVVRAVGRTEWVGIGRGTLDALGSEGAWTQLAHFKQALVSSGVE